MKYPLDYNQKPQNSLLFWMCKFIKHKLSSLSNKEVKNPSALINITTKLSFSELSLDELEELVKEARNIGLIGINVYFTPLKKLFLSTQNIKLYSLTQIDEEFISDILAGATAGLSDASKKNYRIALLSFFKYLDSQNEEDGKSHLFNIELKHWGGIVGKKGEKLPEYMNEQELERFLEAINNCPFKYASFRNRLIIKLIIYTGIRVSEATSIMKKDISTESDCYIIRIRGKGNKYRVVLIRCELIKDLLEKVLQESQSELLFTNRKNERLTQAYVSRIVEQVLMYAGVRKEKNGAHMLRHTFATLLYRKRKDIILVQEALGHASLNTSRIYTHFDNERLKEAANVAHEFAIK